MVASLRKLAGRPPGRIRYTALLPDDEAPRIVDVDAAAYAEMDVWWARTFRGRGGQSLPAGPGARRMTGIVLGLLGLWLAAALRHMLRRLRPS